MGALLSTRAAEDKAEEAQKTIDAVIKSFQDKRDLYLDALSKARGPNAANKTLEVTGGRTISLYSEIFYTEKVGANSEITDAMNSFFRAADQGIDGDSAGAQHSAVQGAKSLIMAAIDGILGDMSIGAREVTSFSVIFLNNSFVRLDYRFFQQNIDVVKYLAAVRSTARLIVCEIAVLPIEEMKPAEISYLLSQAFDLQSFSDPNKGFATVGKLQTDLVQVSVLTAMLQQVLKDQETEIEENGTDASSVEARSQALLALSKNVNSVLNQISQDLNEPTSFEVDQQRSIVLETAIKDAYTDAGLDAQGSTSFFLKQMDAWNNSSGSLQDGIRTKAQAIVQEAFLNYNEAFIDINEDSASWTPSYKTWYQAHRTDYAIWWFDFLNKIHAKTSGKIPFEKTKEPDQGDGNSKESENSKHTEKELEENDILGKMVAIAARESGQGDDNSKDSKKEAAEAAAEEELSKWLKAVSGTADLGDGATETLKSALKTINDEGNEVKTLFTISAQKMKRQLKQVVFTKTDG